jgi:GcrA cell cycle regulator
MMAARMGCGFSRNAIIGKLHRLGLSNAYSRIHADNQMPKKKKVNRKTTRIVRANGNSNQRRIVELVETDLEVMRCVEVVPHHVELLDLERHHCRYPYGESPFTFCGHATMEGRSYCGPHYALSMRTQRPVSPAVQEQRRRTARANYRLALVEVA